jgi:hypothetical protein
MFPNSPFNSPVSSFQTPVQPPGVDPDQGDQVGVIFSAKWLPFIIGSLFQLLQQTTWIVASDGELNIVQGQAFDLINLFALAAAPKLPNTAVGLEDDMPFFREVCDGGVTYLEFLACACPETWQRLALAAQVPVGGQPGGGTPQPQPGGGAQIYCTKLLGSGLFYLPTLVSTGDILTLTSYTDAWWDGGEIHWRCPDGKQFEVGVCVDAPYLVGSDPLPSTPHMSVIANINGTFYPFFPGATLVVPGGVSMAQVTLQANDSALGNNQGDAAICVQVQNNQAGTWEQAYDFTRSPYTNISFNPVAPGVWVPGAGYVTQYNQDGVTAGFRDFFMDIATLHAGTVTDIIATFVFTAGSLLGPNDTYYVAHDSTILATVVEPTVPTSPQAWSGTATVTSKFSLQLLAGDVPGVADPGGSATLQTLVFRGTGPNPFV